MMTMIKYLPVIAIVAVSIYLFMKAFDCLLETVIYFHSLHKYRLVFEDYEAELYEVGEDADAALDLKAHLAEDVTKYGKLAGVHPWRYRCWKMMCGESKLVRAVDSMKA